MKINKKFAILIVAITVTAVFCMPVTAYAEDEIENEPILTSDSAEPDIRSLFDFVDMSDISDIDKPPNKSAIPVTSKSFTPDGQASVVDLAYEGDGKMFYTFKTPPGSVFYLIIDRQRGADNVYFLSAVTEDDLLALTDTSGKKGNTSAIPSPEPQPTEPTNVGTEANPAIEVEKPPIQGKSSSNTGIVIFVVVGVLAVGGAAYYIKVIRPKQQASVNEDDDMPDDDGSGDEMMLDDEPEENDYYENSDDTDDEDKE